MFNASNVSANLRCIDFKGPDLIPRINNFFSFLPLFTTAVLPNLLIKKSLRILVLNTSCKSIIKSGFILFIFLERQNNPRKVLCLDSKYKKVNFRYLIIQR